MKTRSLDDLSDVFLMCRTMGHAWEPQVTFVERHGRKTLHRGVWVCGREANAGVKDPTQKEVLSLAAGRSRGSLFEPPTYRYADGYLVAEHLGRGRSRPASRATLMDRFTAPAKEKEPKRNGLKAV